MLPLSQLPKYIKENIKDSENLKSKQELNEQLILLIQDYLSVASLDLSEEEVKIGYQDLPEWRIDTSLAKLRSLLEIKAKNQIKVFCSSLPEPRRKNIQKLLSQAGVYNFRSSIELDLYVGIHTAISAYFKMLGVALNTMESYPEVSLQDASKELFRTLRFIASLPLRYLMAFDGLFWDSKRYTIPKIFTAKLSETGLVYFLPKEEIEERFNAVELDEKQTGCPALRAKTSIGQPAFELVEKICVDCVENFFIRRVRLARNLR